MVIGGSNPHFASAQQTPIAPDLSPVVPRQAAVDTRHRHHRKTSSALLGVCTSQHPATVASMHGPGSRVCARAPVHAENTFLDRRGHKRCRTCQRDSEARRVRDYSIRKTARCSSCGRARYPSFTIRDGVRVQQPTQACHPCRRARRAPATSAP